MNILGRVLIPLVATPRRVAALRRHFARYPRLLAWLREATFWLSTVGTTRLSLSDLASSKAKPARQPADSHRNQFAAVLAINEAAADKACATDIEGLIRDVFATLPDVNFPSGAQSAFALLKCGRSIAEAVEAARERGIADRDINIGLHAFLLRRLPSPETRDLIDGLEPIAFIARILSRRDFKARSGEARSLQFDI